jgi:hypothetical protein
MGMARIIRRGVLGLLAALSVLALSAGPSFAATGSWTIAKTHGMVAANGLWSTLFFQKAQTSLPPNPVITSASTVTIPTFNGESAKGTVSVRHSLTGGTYPATGGTTQDSVTLNYQY